MTEISHNDDYLINSSDSIVFKLEEEKSCLDITLRNKKVNGRKFSYNSIGDNKLTLKSDMEEHDVDVNGSFYVLFWLLKSSSTGKYFLLQWAD